MTLATAIVKTVAFIACVVWLVRLLRGDVPTRDSRGRLRPGFAALACLAGLAAVAWLVWLVLGLM
jgi:hypothetical protein